jgi:FkbH-like protein
MMRKGLTKFPLRDARTAWRNWIRIGAVPDLDLGVVSSFTVDAMAPYLGHALLSAGWSPRIRIAPFNQVFQTLLAPQVAFGGSPPGILLVLPRLDELVAEELAWFCNGDSSVWSHARDKLLELTAAVTAIREGWHGTLILGTFPPPTTPEFDVLHLDRLGVLFFERASAFWREAIAAVDGVRLLDVCALANDFGMRHAFDPRMWYLYHQPFSEQFLFELGNYAARLISATCRASGKCAVVDCDNTVWGGIIGEDGLDGIQLGHEFPGSAYRDFQNLLLQWRRQGVFLAVCSKNNPEDVRQVFRHHRAMVLRESDISAWAVDWRPKSEQLTQIAKDLNIGTDALVFFDDSPYEIAEVLAQHPKVQCIKIPSAPELIVSVARRAMPFDKVEITKDDRSRVERYTVELRRDELRQSLPIGEFIRTLGLRVDTVHAGTDNLVRITQLINKTNQFRLTDVRLTEDQVRTMVQSPDYIVRAAEVRDKFGEYGVTCVGILERRSRDWHISVFLLSCRVLGRGVETCFLADLASEVLARGGSRMTAEFIPTGRNAIAADFLDRHGFTKLDSRLWWHSAAELAANRLTERLDTDHCSVASR